MRISHTHTTMMSWKFELEISNLQIKVILHYARPRWHEEVSFNHVFKEANFTIDVVVDLGHGPSSSRV